MISTGTKYVAYVVGALAFLTMASIHPFTPKSKSDSHSPTTVKPTADRKSRFNIMRYSYPSTQIEPSKIDGLPVAHCRTRQQANWYLDTVRKRMDGGVLKEGDGVRYEVQRPGGGKKTFVYWIEEVEGVEGIMEC
ncbi:hypothetical protein P153DRAFT_368652 [Dothidotthia symphoricarpi CBS 119687]|uniref:Uncharacterized protein n=1 Tax=Dothidotthia symphoricarpi CBS 119687 TaxID=1392245 RepID=A0A6A6A810_9PLEO|nr:uncharacterized protein P153DRAFT_368652 [Dothidotthia symphoricarpi CBS 119687]KAF2127345.1 hypothetical protein P153DRAFT_368652 [Dothidotthia symphoricarpi CBS 119687]